ncbi:hypothetical protein [Enterococcus mundtii]|uniref:hypothetical protein n=1 Tax=Enterococcus mundtii TaxID=53346 RepID=UPI001A96DC56|nr:hypothetical protein [Enterococcus mundtii]MBO1087139.1 hypothetical protein [Enterococcus mundtii]
MIKNIYILTTDFDDGMPEVVGVFTELQTAKEKAAELKNELISHYSRSHSKDETEEDSTFTSEYENNDYYSQFNLYEDYITISTQQLINKEKIEYDKRTDELTERFTKNEIAEYEYNILLDDLHAEYFDE